MNNEKLSFRDLYDTSKVSQGVQLYSIAVLMILTFLVMHIAYSFIFPGVVLGMERDKLSVARTQMPLDSYLYRTRDPAFEVQSTLSKRVFDPIKEQASRLSHPEPWDRWNPPKCGGQWVGDRRF